jgi:hypothetical protein
MQLPAMHEPVTHALVVHDDPSVTCRVVHVPVVLSHTPRTQAPSSERQSTPTHIGLTCAAPCAHVSTSARATSHEGVASVA